MTTRVRRRSPNPHKRYKPKFRADKFRELVLYHADRAIQTDESKYDPIKLQKLLWLTDMLAYGRLGESVTGATYIRKLAGPVASEFLPQITNLQKEKAAAPQRVVRDGREIERWVALKPADVQKFSAREIQIAEEAVALFAKIDSPLISKWTHGLRGWRNSRMDEEIPYESILLAEQIPDGLVEYARQVVIDNHKAWEAEAVRAT